MKLSTPSLLLSAAAAVGFAFSLSAAEAEAGFEPIFNGKDLTGWDGRTNHWTVEDGAITGQTSATNPAKGNNFLIWRAGTVDDFELRLAYKFTGNWGNSGVQYRSKDFGDHVAGGYQADMEVGDKYSGILYEERMTRGIMAERGEKVVWNADGKKEVAGSVGDTKAIQAAIQTNGWNEYVITAMGNHLVHQINGHVTVDVTDNDEKHRAASGILALQLHQGPPMKIQFKNLRLKRLSGGAKSAAAKLDGVWTPAEGIMGGNPVSKDDLESITVTIAGGKYTSVIRENTDKGAFTVDESKSPHTMDVTSDGGAQILAIYELSADTLRVCYAFNSTERPKEFKSETGSQTLLVTYKKK